MKGNTTMQYGYGQQNPGYGIQVQVPLLGIQLGKPACVPNIPTPPELQQALPDIASAVQFVLEDKHNATPAHTFIYNRTADRQFNNQNFTDMLRSVLLHLDGVMRQQPNSDLAQQSLYVSEIVMGAAAAQAAQNDRNLGQLIDNNAAGYLDHCVANMNELRNMVRGSGYGGAYGNYTPNRGYNNGGNYGSGGYGYNRPPPMERSDARNNSTMYRRTNALSSPPPAQEPTMPQVRQAVRRSMPSTRLETAIQPNNQANTYQPASTAVQKPMLQLVTEADWRPSEVQPYKPLYPVGVTEIFIRQENGEVYSAIDKDKPVDYKQHAAYMGAPYPYKNPEARNDKIAKIKERMVKKEEQVNHPTITGELASNDLKIVTDRQTLYSVTDAKMWLDMASADNEIVYHAQAGVVTKLLFADAQDMSFHYSLRNVKTLEEMADILMDCFRRDRRQPSSDKVSVTVARYTDAIFTRTLNQVLARECSVEGLSIESFATDYHDLIDVLIKRGMENLVVNRLKANFLDTIRGKTDAMKDEDMRRMALSHYDSAMLSTLSSEEYDKVINNNIIIYGEAVIVATLGVQATDLEFDLQTGAWRNIVPSTHPWLYELGKDLLEADNTYNDLPYRSFFRTLDGYEFEFTRGYLDKNCIILTRVS